MDPGFPKAHRVTIREGKIFDVTMDKSLKKIQSQGTEVVDCKGRTVFPGFIDAHFHLHGFVESLTTLSLGPGQVHSIPEIQEKIRSLTQTLPPGTWVRGGGYNDFYLAEKRHPNRWDLDRTAPSHPVKISHRSGHAHVLNSIALKLLAISGEASDPPGGLIDRDLKTGEPTGLLFGMGDFLAKEVPNLDDQELEQGIKLADGRLLSLGITSLQDASARNGIERWRRFERWKQAGLLQSRISMMLGMEGFREHQKGVFFPPLGKSQLRLGGVKIIIQETTGQLFPTQEELNQMVLEVHRSGTQVALHALEENTIEAACSAVEFALREFPRNDHRHRIEHCAVCPPSLAKRIGSLGITVVTQPSFIYYSGERYLRTVPDGQAKFLYPLATLLKKGIPVAGGSDCPIVPADPMVGIYASVSRLAENGEVLTPEEKISPSEAARMATIEAARSSFEEKVKGSISPGKLADLVVLNEDPTEVPPEEIKDIEVEMTILNGQIVWKKN